jgi:hypothetical protein
LTKDPYTSSVNAILSWRYFDITLRENPGVRSTDDEGAGVELFFFCRLLDDKLAIAPTHNIVSLFVQLSCVGSDGR